jgi:UDP-hydrolysing UDP-N-acetyl-D-glucosamine 2-epimerase
MQARVFSSICHSLAFYVANTPPFALIVTGDRFETLAASVSAAYSHIKLIHIQGGEISGNIDNKVRYATTSLADVHIACSTIAFDRLIRLGIHSDRVRFFGCPSIDLIYEDNSDISLWEHTYPDLMRLISNPYLICINHPDTENRHGNLSNARHLSKALSKTKVGKLIVQGNADAGFSSASIVEFDNVTHNDYIFVDNLPYKLFLHCLRRCSCIVGNSSVAFREAAVLGIPAINLGQRQDDRDTFHNILSLSYDCPDLHERILSHSANRFASTTVFGLGDAGTKIANFLYSLLSDESQS